MTGWTFRTGSQAGQREKIYAIIRNESQTVYDITRQCWSSGDASLVHIKSTTVRRCLQELRDHHPKMAIKDNWTDEWMGIPIKV